MKVLLLIDSLVSGGRERRMIELVKGLGSHADVQLKLVVFSDQVHYKEIYELVAHVILIKRVPKRNPLVFYKLFKLCKQWKPDLIHSWGTMSAIFAIPSSILLNIKLINGNVADAPKNMGFFDERLFRARLTIPFSTVIVGNSLAGLEAYNIPKHKGVCIYNGFDENRILHIADKNSIRNKFDVGAEKVIGMVGGFFDRKDFETFIQAAMLLLNHRKDVTFIAVGDGPNLMNCKAMIPSALTSYFIFTGSQTDVESIVNCFDIGVLSTKTKVHGEGISNAILEYMALEKPVVATSGGGTNEIVAHGKTGFLVPPDSPQAMADAFRFLLDNPHEGRVMGLEGKKLLHRSFSLTKMTEAYYQLYQKLLV